MSNISLYSEGMLRLSKIKVYLRREYLVQIDLMRFTREPEYAHEILTLASGQADQTIKQAAQKLLAEMTGPVSSVADNNATTNKKQRPAKNSGNSVFPDTAIATSFPSTRIE